MHDKARISDCGSGWDDGIFLPGCSDSTIPPAVGELGGTEVLMFDAMRPEPRSLRRLPQPLRRLKRISHVRPVGGWAASVREISATQ